MIMMINMIMMNMMIKPGWLFFVQLQALLAIVQPSQRKWSSGWCDHNCFERFVINDDVKDCIGRYFAKFAIVQVHTTLHYSEFPSKPFKSASSWRWASAVFVWEPASRGNVWSTFLRFSSTPPPEAGARPLKPLFAMGGAVLLPNTRPGNLPPTCAVCSIYYARHRHHNQVVLLFSMRQHLHMVVGEYYLKVSQ